MSGIHFIGCRQWSVGEEFDVREVEFLFCNLLKGVGFEPHRLRLALISVWGCDGGFHCYLNSIAPEREDGGDVGR